MLITPKYLDIEERPYKTEKEDYRRRLARAQEALITHPEDRELIWNYMAIMMQRAGDYQECIDHCKLVLPQMTIEDCIDEVMLFMSYSYKQSGLLDEAIEVRKQMMERKQDFKGLDIINIIKYYEEKKDIPNAIKYYEIMMQACNYICDNEDYRSLAKHYDSIQDYENSLKYYEYAGRDVSNEVYTSWGNAARALALMGREDEAMFILKMTLKLNPDYAFAHHLLGIVYANKGDVFMAMHHYSEALRIQPEYPEVINNLAGLTFDEFGDIAGTVIKMENALTMNPSKEVLVLLYNNLSILYGKIVDYDKQEFYKNKMMEELGLKEKGDDDDK